MSDEPKTISREDLAALLKEVADKTAQAVMDSARQGYEAALPRQFARVAAQARAQAFEAAAKVCQAAHDDGRVVWQCVEAIRALAAKEAK